MSVPIVGVGASAGGLEAFTELLKHLPVDSGLGFVLVQHLDPQHESALTQLLSRATSMPVLEATHQLRVEANHIYIIPPNTTLGLAQGLLTLRPRPQDRGVHHPIDAFLEALAQDQHECAIGVILSGTATDGTLGLEAIKAGGGITFVQDETAKYDSMPRSAVAAGCVDFVLSPEHIAHELARLAKHPYLARATGAAAPEFPAEAERDSEQREGADVALASGGPGTLRAGAKRARAGAKDLPPSATELGYNKIVLLLHNHCGVDFSLYKSTTIRRRITRRMVLNRHLTVENYARVLRGDAKELDALYSDCLISVTSFFRNPKSFELLQRKVFPKLLQQRSRADQPLRIWVLGCSTGQEAYSLAMALHEAQAKTSGARTLQIFATDLNEAVLDKARHGLYSKNLTQDVSPERLRRFFVEEDGGYRVIKSLREMVVFARHNLIAAPPFSRMDLISCRNLLIYLDSSSQKKALPMFHYALQPEGFLFLGASESILGFTDLFEPVDKECKIFARKAGVTPSFHMPKKKGADGPVAKRVLPPGALRESALPPEMSGELNAQCEADRLLVNQFAPPGVLINAEGQILQFRGATRAYLEPPKGQATFNVLQMAREGLMLPLRTALDKAKKENKTVRREGVRLQRPGQPRLIHLEVIPLKNLRERCFLILFEEAKGQEFLPKETKGTKKGQRGQAESSASLPSSASEKSPATIRRVAELERDLAETRDYLQAIHEQHQAGNEVLQSSNEEVQSANEELQSINEELETAKEELESSNEELTTVNEEMASRNLELNRLYSDLTNLQNSTRLAILLLGRDLTIRRFSEQAEKQFRLTAADVGRPVRSIRHPFVFAETPSERAAGSAAPRDLEALLSQVITTVREHEVEVQDRDGRWSSLRARPYFTLDNQVDGAVLVVVDIHELKRAEREIKASGALAEAIIRTARDPLLVLRADLRVDTANEAFYTTFQTAPNQTEGRLIYEVGDGAWNIPKLRALLEDVLPRNSFFNDFEVTHDFPHLGRRTLLLNARRLEPGADLPPLILLAIEDVTERLESRLALRRSEIRYRRLFEAAQDGILILNSGTRKITEANPCVVKVLGFSRDELVGKELWEIGLLKDEKESQAAFRELLRQGEIRYENLPLKTKSGEHLEVEFVSNVHDEDGQQVIQCNIRDITERQQVLKALRTSEGFNRSIIESSPDCIKVLDLAGNLLSMVSGQDLVGIADIRPYLRKPWFDLWTAEDDRRAAETAVAAAAAGREGNFVGFFSTLRGEDKWWDVSVSPILGGAGRPEFLLAVSRDITARKHAEEVIRASEERFRMLADNMAQLAWTCDELGTVTWYNQRWLDFTGLSFEELKGWGWKQCHHPDHVNRVVATVQQARDSGEIWEDTFPLRGADGQYRWFLSRAVPIRNPADEIVRWLGTNTDVTDQRAAQEALRLAQALLADRAGQLEQAVTERTHELARTNEQLEAFVYSIAHDLRAPLRAMQGFSDLLVQEAGNSLSAKSLDFAGRISRSALFMDSLLKDLLAFSRVAQQEVQLTDVNLEATVRTVAARLENELQERGARLELAGPWPAVRAHEATLGQVLFNLISNALKFNAPGVPPVVRVRVQEWAALAPAHAADAPGPSGHWVRVWVEDNGIGIAPEYHDKVFRLFTRLHGPAFGGTGVGLAIVQKGVERMGGRLGVESALGAGSRFWFELRQA